MKDSRKRRAALFPSTGQQSAFFADLSLSIVLSFASLEAYLGVWERRISSHTGKKRPNRIESALNE